MTKKFKMKGKTYTVIEELEAGDISIIKYRAKVQDSKNNVFTLIQSVTGFYLYDNKEHRYAEANSAQEWEA